MARSINALARLARATRLGAISLAALLACAGVPVSAQTPSPATLIADGLRLDGRDSLIAEGNVEIFYQGSRLKAKRVHYTRTKGQLEIQGPITLTDAKGTLVLADSASLSDDMREGILKSARVVLDQQLQIAAADLQRVAGRQMVLNRAVASSCQVCATDPTPLWEIRAKRIVHDEVERQIYFDHAQMRLGGVPIFWLPYLRLPDPTLDRTAGIMMPRLLSTSRLGVGIEVPYFLPLGDNRDLMLRPMMATEGVRSLGLRYREAFRGGELTLTGAVSHDDILAKQRGWLGVEGRFTLPRGYQMMLSGVMVSDPAYFRDYGLSDEDRLYSQVGISRTRKDKFIGSRLVHTHSIREGENNSELPQFTSGMEWVERIRPAKIGGVVTLNFGMHSHRRSSDRQIVGRDVARGTLGALWRRDWQSGNGLILATELGAMADFHRIAQDPNYPDTIETVTPMAMVELRWPWARQTATGGVDVIEPIVQVVWSNPSRLNHVPNEDSPLVEFDEGNLFGLNRFAGVDRREAGTRINAGVQWARIGSNGIQINASMGRVIRLSQKDQFTAESGLGGDSSDWITSLHLASDKGWLFQGRAVFDDGFSMARGEMRLGIERPRFGLSAGWLWAEADPAEYRYSNTSEWVLDGRLALNEGWNAFAEARHDFGTGETTAAGLGLDFSNECLRVGLTVERNMTSSTDLRPSTNLSLAVDVLGFGAAKGQGQAARSCRY